jgi:hypothetical protein
MWTELFAVGTSAFNTFATFKAQQEQRRENIYQQQATLNHAKAKKRKATQEYGAIVSFQMDMLRQNQMGRRQELGANILQSGMVITPYDSTGLLLRHQAYHDEMSARAKETEFYHNRPRLGVNKDLILHNIDSVKKSAPWQNLATSIGGGIDLIKTLDKIQSNIVEEKKQRVGYVPSSANNSQSSQQTKSSKK